MAAFSTLPSRSMASASASFDLCSGLVPDHQLSSLPPLPETPRRGEGSIDISTGSSEYEAPSHDELCSPAVHGFASRKDDTTGDDYAKRQQGGEIKRSESTAIFSGRNLARTPHTRTISGGQMEPREDGGEVGNKGEADHRTKSEDARRPANAAHTDRVVSGGSMPRSDSYRGLGAYPVFSARQGGMNTPRRVSPVNSLFSLPVAAAAAVETLPDVNDNGNAEGIRAAEVNTTSSVDVNTSPRVAKRSPGKSPAKRSPTKRPSPAVQDLFSPPRRPVNPASIPLPETPAPPKQLLVPDTNASGVSAASSSRSVSTSFLFPAGDASMIGDCRPPTAFGFGREEDSFDFDIEQIRPLTNRKARLGRQEEDEAREGTLASPSKDTLTIPAIRRLNESTLLPSSPRADLLASTNAISRVSPPWTDRASESINSSVTITDLTEQDVASTSSRRSPRKTPRSASKTKRSFPASSSDKSLATVGEHDFLRVPSSMLDQSTILPVSPAKQAHLLGREHMLLDEDMSLLANDEGNTMNLPPQMRIERQEPVPQISHEPIATSSRTPRKRASPTKKAEPRDEVWNQTLDLKELMARAKKPKRASGTEESFADLLNGDHELDGMNDFDPDETFLPASLRKFPHAISQRDLATMPSLPANIPRSRSSQVLQSDLVSPAKSTHPSDSARRSRRRSKSLTETDPKPVAVDIPFTKRKTPAKMPPPPAPMVARPRQSMLPPTAASRRISLSAGAMPIMTSASIKRLDLPGTGAGTSGRITGVPRASIAPISAAGVASGAKRTSLAPAPIARRTSIAPPSAVASGATNTTATRPRLGSTTTSTVTARASFQPRSKSISETVTTSASQPRLVPSVRGSTSSRLTAGSSATTARAGLPSGGVSTTAGLSRPSARVAGLPQPARDGSARSTVTRPIASTAASTIATSSSRQFGTEAGRTINRLSRTTGLPAPPAASTGTARAGLSSKLSAGPSASPSKREAASSTTIKARALSTPASALTRAAGPTARTAAAIGTSGLPARKSSVPPERTTGLTRTTAIGPTRLPIGGVASGRTGTVARGISTTTTTSSGAGGTGSTGSTRAIADIRAKLSMLEKRTTTVRR